MAKQRILHFPEGFLWGTASSSHQCEGGNINNQWYRGIAGNSKGTSSQVKRLELRTTGGKMQKEILTWPSKWRTTRCA